MAFPASQQALAEGLRLVQLKALRHKAFMTNARNQMAANTISANQVLGVMFETAAIIKVLDTASALPGIAQYTKDQLEDQALDVVAEFQSMRAALAAVRDWTINNFPKDAGGFILKDTLTPDGDITVRQFTSAQTAGLRTELDAAIATIG